MIGVISSDNAIHLVLDFYLPSLTKEKGVTANNGVTETQDDLTKTSNDVTDQKDDVTDKMAELIVNK